MARMIKSVEVDLQWIVQRLFTPRGKAHAISLKTILKRLDQYGRSEQEQPLSFRLEELEDVFNTLMETGCQFGDGQHYVLRIKLVKGQVFGVRPFFFLYKVDGESTPHDLMSIDEEHC